MVYCGKPSKGCSVCRERKVRCDQKEPSCGQCLKRGHQCPGYRNLVDLMFRDESNHVIKKATNTRSRVAKTANQTTQTDSTASEAKEPLPASSFAPRSAPRRTSPIVPQILHPRQRPEPSPPSSSPRSTSSLRIVQEPKAKSRRQLQRQTRTRRFGSYNHSTLLGVLTPQSGRVSSIASDDSRSDDERETGIHQLVFNYYDPELDTCVPQLQLDGAEGEDTDSTDEGEDSLKPPGSLTYSLSPSLCERGTAFFFSRYVSVEPSCHQGFDFIYEIWKPPQHSGAYFASTVDGVTASMIAVGLAGLSKLTGSREAQVQAQHSYGIALNLTNAALRDPAKCATDSTMLAVLILGTYEFLAGRSPQTMSAWQEHVSGAAALASMRGKAQFATNAGTRMFLMLCHSVLVNCIQSGLPMPHSMVQLRIELVRRSESQGASWRLAEPIYRALQARYDINIGLITNLDEIIEKLTDIDNEFADLLASLPESWSYRSVRLQQDNPAAFGRFCHIYGGLQQVTLWNGLRTVRMLVHETILEQLCTYASTFLSTNMLPEHYQHLLVKTMSMLEMLGDAIIASVPQHFGVVSSRNVDFGGSRKGSSPLPHETETIKAVLSRTQSRSSTPPQTTVNPALPAPTGPTLFDPMKAPGGEGIAERFMTLASSSNTILWPLYVLGMSSSCSQEKRDYVLDRLDAVYQETKLDQARIVSRLLESKTASVAWDSIPLTQLPSLPAESLLRAV